MKKKKITKLNKNTLRSLETLTLRKCPCYYSGKWYYVLRKSSVQFLSSSFITSSSILLWLTHTTLKSWYETFFSTLNWFGFFYSVILILSFLFKWIWFYDTIIVPNIFYYNQVLKKKIWQGSSLTLYILFMVI